MSNADPDRVESLLDLIRLRVPIESARARLAGFGWDSDTELVTIFSSDVIHAMDSFGTGHLSDAELVAWAETIQGRDDVKIEAENEALIKGALFELSTPELFGPLPELVSALKSQFQ